MRRIFARFTVYSLALSLGWTSSSQALGQEPQFQPAEQPQSQSAPPGQAATPLGQPPVAQPQADVVATVNGQAITKPELESTVSQRLNDLQQAAQAQGQVLDPNAAQQVREETLDTLIESRLVEQYVVENGPAVEEAEVTSTIQEVKQQLAAQQVPFEQFLVSRGHTEESFKKRVLGSLAWQKFQQQQVNPEKLQAFFEQNRASFQAESFEQAQGQVVQAYIGSLWSEIVEQMKPKAKIELADASQRRAPDDGFGAPGGFAPQP